MQIVKQTRLVGGSEASTKYTFYVNSTEASALLDLLSLLYGPDIGKKVPVEVVAKVKSSLSEYQQRCLVQMLFSLSNQY